jgi:translocation and assembly module TamB
MNRRLRRLIRRLAPWLAGLLLLALLTPLSLNLPAVQRVLLDRLNSRLAGELRLARLDLSLWPLGLQLEGLVLTDTGGRELARLEGLQVRVSLTGLLTGQVHIHRIELDHPWLLLEGDGEGRPTLLAVFADLLPSGPSEPPSAEGAAPRVTIDHARIRSARIEVRHWAGLDGATLERLDLVAGGHIRPGSRALELDLELAGLTLDHGRGPLALDHLALELKAAGDRIEHLHLDLAGSGLSLDLAGEAGGPWPGTTAHLHGELQALLDDPRLAPWLAPVSGGRLEGRFALDGPLRDPRATLDLWVGGLAGLPGPPDSLVTRLELEQRVIRLDQAVIQGDRGRLDLALALDASRALPGGLDDSLRGNELSLELDGHWQRLDLAPWLGQALAAGRGSGRMHLESRGLGLAGLSGRLDLDSELEDLSVSGADRPFDARLELAAALDSLSIRLDRLRIHLPGGSLESTGSVLRGDSTLALEARWQLESGHLPFARSLLATDSGTVTGTLTLGGFVTRPELRLHAAHGGGHLAGRGLEGLELEIIADSRRARVYNRLDLGPAGLLQLDLEGRSPGPGLRGWLPPALPAWTLSAALDSLELSALAPDSLLGGRIHGRLAAEGWGTGLSVLRSMATLDLGGPALVLPGLRGPVPLAARMDLSARPGLLALDSLDLRLAGARLGGHSSWSPSGDRLEGELHLAVPSLSTLPLADSLAGRLAGKLRLAGTLARPALSLQLHGEDLWTPWQALGRLDLALDHGPDSTHLEHLGLELAPGQSLLARGSRAADGRIRLEVDTDTLALAHFSGLPGPLMGRVALGLDARGLWPALEVEGHLRGDSLSYGDQRLPDLAMTLTGDGDSLWVSARQFFRMQAGFQPRTGELSARLVVPEQDLGPYLALAGLPDLGLRSGLELSLAGNSHRPGELSARLRIPRLRFTAWDGPVIEGENLAAVWHKGRLGMDGFRLHTPGQGFLDLSGSGSADSLAFRLMGLLPLELAAPFSPALADLEGRLKLSGLLVGSLARPVPGLDLELEQAGLTLPLSDQRVHHLDARLRLRRESLRLEQLSGSLDEGRFQAGGHLNLAGLQPDSLDLWVKAQALELDLPGTLHALAELDLRARGDRRHGLLDGEATVLEGLYYGDLELDPGRLAGLVTRRRESTTRAAATTLPPLLRNMELDIALTHRRPFVVENNLVSAELAPDLQLRGSLANPLPAGRARIHEGQLRFAGREFEIDRGIVDFVDPSRINPELDIQSTVRVIPRDPGTSDQWTITLTVDGTAEAPRLRLSSVPAEEDEDVLSILLTGRRSADLAALTGSGDLNVQQVLGRLLLASAQENLRRVSGLDVLALELGDSRDTGGTATDRLKLTVGKSLTRRLATYWSLESSQGSLVRTATAELRLLDELTLAGFQNSLQEAGGEVKLKREFR